MGRFIIRRLSLIPITLLLINFLSFAYAHLARPLRAARNPNLMGSIQNTPLFPTYADYLHAALRLDFGSMPGSGAPIIETVTQAGIASLGLLALTLLISSTLGTLLGVLATRVNPPHTADILTIVATGGLALPTFYLGVLFVMALIYSVIFGANKSGQLLLPTRGFGWDNHLVLPLLTLLPRPLVQIAQVTSNLLVDELHQDYVKTERGFGYRWQRILRKLTTRNILAQLILSISGMLRFIVGELIIVEFLFAWTGIGRLIALTLVPAQISTATGSPLFLNPQVLAAMVTALAAVFLLTDLVTAVFVRLIDPRLAIHHESTAYG